MLWREGDSWDDAGAVSTRRENKEEIGFRVLSRLVHHAFICELSS